MKLTHTLLATALTTFSELADAESVFGVSWSIFHEERWMTVEGAILEQLAKAGATRLSFLFRVSDLNFGFRFLGSSPQGVNPMFRMIICAEIHRL